MESVKYELFLLSDAGYYVKMMVAWYFATALAARWDEIIENRAALFP